MSTNVFIVYSISQGCVFVFLGEFQKALYFMKVTQPAVQGVSDVKLFLSVLLANG